MKKFCKGIYYNRHEGEKCELGINFFAKDEFTFGGFRLFYPLWPLGKQIYQSDDDCFYYGSHIVCFHFHLRIRSRKAKKWKWHQIIMWNYSFYKKKFGKQFLVEILEDCEIYDIWKVKFGKEVL